MSCGKKNNVDIFTARMRTGLRKADSFFFPSLSLFSSVLVGTVEINKDENGKKGRLCVRVRAEQFHHEMSQTRGVFVRADRLVPAPASRLRSFGARWGGGLALMFYASFPSGLAYVA